MTLRICASPTIATARYQLSPSITPAHDPPRRHHHPHLRPRRRRMPRQTPRPLHHSNADRSALRAVPTQLPYPRSRLRPRLRFGYHSPTASPRRLRQPRPRWPHLPPSDFSLALDECFRVLASKKARASNGRMGVFPSMDRRCPRPRLTVAGFTSLTGQTRPGLNGPQTWLFRLVQKPSEQVLLAEQQLSTSIL